MAAILFSGAEQFEQTFNTLSTESLMSNLVKTARAVSWKKTFQNYTILYKYIAQGQGQIPRWDKILIVTKTFLLVLSYVVSFSH